ncbi:MAG: hypothetical protein ABI877_17525 [Gemmatimonadaceae bacterium]
MMQRLKPIGWAALSALLALACGKKDVPPPADSTSAMAPAPAPAPSVTGIELGRRLGPNQTIAEAGSVFGRRDTIYVSVIAQNAVPTSSLTAKWTFGTGQLVDSTTQAFARTDAVNTTTTSEFHISKKTPWPAGKYRVEIWLDGVSVGSRDFEIK